MLYFYLIIQFSMEINEAIIKETKNCNKDFSCLENKDQLYCKVKKCISNSIHFIECNDDLSCLYNLNYGDSNICTCPVRKEIFNKYQL